MKKCKACNGKGFIFQKSEVFTGKNDRLFGFEIPIMKPGAIQITCGKCFGKGVK